MILTNDRSRHKRSSGCRCIGTRGLGTNGKLKVTLVCNRICISVVAHDDNRPRTALELVFCDWAKTCQILLQGIGLTEVVLPCGQLIGIVRSQWSVGTKNLIAVGVNQYIIGKVVLTVFIKVSTVFSSVSGSFTYRQIEIRM